MLVQVKTYKAPAFFTFHFANAYEEGGSLHVDFGGYKDAKVGWEMWGWVLHGQRQTATADGSWLPLRTSFMWGIRMQLRPQSSHANDSVVTATQQPLHHPMGPLTVQILNDLNLSPILAFPGGEVSP